MLDIHVGIEDVTYFNSLHINYGLCALALFTIKELKIHFSLAIDYVL